MERNITNSFIPLILDARCGYATLDEVNAKSINQSEQIHIHKVSDAQAGQQQGTRLELVVWCRGGEEVLQYN